MKTKFTLTAILAVLLASVINSASAECVYGCPNPDGSFSSTSPTYTPPTTFSVKGSGYHQGTGTGFANGDQGFVKAESWGGTNTQTTLNTSGNLCPGSTCTSGNYAFQGSSWQRSETAAGAISTGGQAAASVGNSGSTNVGLNFMKH